MTFPVSTSDHVQILGACKFFVGYESQLCIIPMLIFTELASLRKRHLPLQ